MTPGLRVIERGLLVTLQDAGRSGWQRFGLPPSGALDDESRQAANVLAGNAAAEGALEIIGTGPILRVEAASVRVAVAGCAPPFVLETPTATINVPPLQSAIAREGDVLKFGPPRGGMAYYLAVEGGFEAAAKFGSVSTYVRARIGGFGGGSIAAGELLPLRRNEAGDLHPARLDVQIAAPEELRVMRGPDASHFPEAAFSLLLSERFSVMPASDRMGLRLSGPALPRQNGGEMLPAATTPGALQVPPDGQPILLLADRQTTGGYPRIATIISADMSAAGRLQAGMAIRFREVKREEALAALRARRAWLAGLRERVEALPGELLSSERLLSHNLVAGATDGLQDG